MSLTLLACVSQQEYFTSDDIVRLLSRLPWDVISNAIGTGWDPGDFLLLPIPPLQVIYAWINPRTQFSDLKDGIRCFSTSPNLNGLRHPYTQISLGWLKPKNLQITTRDYKSMNNAKWMSKTPPDFQFKAEFVDFVRGRYGAHEVLIKRYKNTSLRYIEREARVVSLASRLDVSPQFMGIVWGGKETWNYPALVLKYRHDAIPLDTYLQYKPMLSRYQVFGLCNQISNALQKLHLDCILLNDLEIGNIAAVGDPNPSLHPLDPKILIYDFSEATFQTPTTYDIPKSARHLFTHTAPEVLNGGATSAKSDVYCLGKVLNEIMKAFRAWDLKYLVSWCCKEDKYERPCVDNVCAYLNGLQILQIQKLDNPLDVRHLEALDLCMKN